MTVTYSGQNMKQLFETMEEPIKVEAMGDSNFERKAAHWISWKYSTTQILVNLNIKISNNSNKLQPFIF